MLDIRNITVQYGQNRPIVENFCLSVGKKEIISIVGESGSGKTTVIRGVLGLLPKGGRVTKGDILFNRSSLLAKTGDEWRKLRGTKISMIFQDTGSMLSPIRKVGRQFTEYIRTHSTLSFREAQAKAREMLVRMRLPEVENIMESYPFQLSGGMRQRVGIAMAMVFEPELLLADEPTSALDVTTQAQIVRQMMALREEFSTSIVLVTHNLSVAAYMSDKIIVMKNGKMIEAGIREQMIRNPREEYTKNLLRAVPELGGPRFV